MPQPSRLCPRALDRRSLCKFGLASFWLITLGDVDCWAQGDAGAAPPQEGDLLVRAGDASAKPLTLTDIPFDAKFVSAWPMEPMNNVVRSGSRLNEVLLIRLDPLALPEATRRSSADGVLAYSALCTHSGCDLSTWLPSEGVFSCDCHGSEFDARTAGRVTVGPARRALPLLDLKVNGEILVVARPFAAPIRFDEG